MREQYLRIATAMGCGLALLVFPLCLGLALYYGALLFFGIKAVTP